VGIGSDFWFRCGSMSIACSSSLAVNLVGSEQGEKGGKKEAVRDVRRYRCVASSPHSLNCLGSTRLCPVIGTRRVKGGGGGEEKNAAGLPKVGGSGISRHLFPRKGGGEGEEGVPLKGVSSALNSIYWKAEGDDQPAREGGKGEKSSCFVGHYSLSQGNISPPIAVQRPLCRSSFFANFAAVEREGRGGGERKGRIRAANFGKEKLTYEILCSTSSLLMTILLNHPLPCKVSRGKRRKKGKRKGETSTSVVGEILCFQLIDWFRRKSATCLPNWNT